MRRSVTLLFCLLLLPLAASALGYRIDPPHSQASFGVRLFWFDHVSGRFTQVEGELLSGLPIGTYVVDARIDANSVVMTSTHMRDWLLAPAFFDAKRYPVIHFRSDPIPQQDMERGGTLSGQLTLRGITRPMRFTLYPTGCHSNARSPCQLTLDGHLQRSQFNMNADRTTLGDRVNLRLSVMLQPEIR